MSRKTIILFCAVLAVMAVGVAAGIAALYSSDGSRGQDVPDESRYLLLPAVPADAVAVCCLSRADKLSTSVFAGFEVPEALCRKFSEGGLGRLSSARMVLSLHYSGKLIPLYVFDAGSAGTAPSAEASELMEFFNGIGFCSRYFDCSSCPSSKKISGRSVVIAGETETIVKASVRHLEQSLSVMEAAGFAGAAAAADGDDIVFLSNSRIKPVFSSVFSRAYFKDVFGAKANEAYSDYAGFCGAVADWTVLTVRGRSGETLHLYGTPAYEQDASAFMSVLGKSSGCTSSLASVLPSYTFFAMSLPMKDFRQYKEAYEAYLDSRQELQNFRWNQSALAKRDTISPADLVGRLGVEEIATASFATGKGLMKINLARVTKADPVILRGTGVKSLKEYVPSANKYAFPSHFAAVFGKEFKLKDESFFTFMNGWLITGSREAVEEYVSGRALEYSLKEYMADAGQEDLLGGRPVSFVAYLNLTSDSGMAGRIFTKDFCKMISSVVSDAEYSPAVLRIADSKKGMQADLGIYRLSFDKVKAPVFERDTIVEVPKGPFAVKNSGTGKTNLLYQNEHKALCLKEEGGKGLWGVPFGQDICGTAECIDYYANGKLQFLFGAGSKIYLIDRLGRFVSGFPVELGKEILIGPAAYDFSGTRKYNILVLHRDNTVEMYNLQGAKPASWKGITCTEKIKGLPERLDAGGNTYWIVRTSVQTLIYPFSGGSPLTDFRGDKMILPSGSVTARDDSSVDVECYDGKVRTVKLK